MVVDKRVAPAVLVAPPGPAKGGPSFDAGKCTGSRSGSHRGGGLSSPRRLRSASVDDMRAYLIAVAVLAVVTVLLFWMVTHPWGCSGVNAETITEEQRVVLIGQGWRGAPDDERDAICPPQRVP